MSHEQPARFDKILDYLYYRHMVANREARNANDRLAEKKRAAEANAFGYAYGVVNTLGWPKAQSSIELKIAPQRLMLAGELKADDDQLATAEGWVRTIDFVYELLGSEAADDFDIEPAHFKNPIDRVFYEYALTHRDRERLEGEPFAGDNLLAIKKKLGEEEALRDAYDLVATWGWPSADARLQEHLARYQNFAAGDVYPQYKDQRAYAEGYLAGMTHARSILSSAPAR